MHGCPCHLSITGDIKIINVIWSKGNDFSILNGEVPYGLLTRSCFSSPSVTRDGKDLLKLRVYKAIMSQLLEMENPMEPFEWVLPTAQIWCF